MKAKRSWSRFVLGGGLMLGTSCLDRPVAPSDPKTTNVYVDEIRQNGVNKIDLLFMIDNSMSMADKQEILGRAVPGLVQRLIAPRIDPRTMQPEFRAIKDIHVGVISSSLGPHGGDHCQDGSDDDDHGRLIGSVRPGLVTWASSGFLAWDPLAQKNPPGESDLNAFNEQFGAMLAQVGQTGCGYESSLEAWYRFLIDPEPPLLVNVEGQTSVASGIDSELLAQRAAFLRPDSLVAIIMLTDENDCSVRDDGLGWLVGEMGSVNAPFAMPRSTSACRSNPNDPCCRPCKSIEPNGPPAGCTALDQDAECQINGGDLDLRSNEDQPNLRCYDQKRRFGMDLLYPTSRYVEGLTSEQIRKRDGTLVPNPLYVSSSGPNRDKSLVFLAGIVGVPWQDVADGASLDGAGLEYLTAKELADNGVWSTILGDPSSGTLPLDPFMIETPAERTGTNPATGAVIQPSSSGTPNVINGREQTNTDNSDLQYACTFRLESTRDCDANAQDCDCGSDDVARNRSLCSASGAGPAETTQYWAKAYPGSRHLEVLKGFGENAIVASICPKVTEAAMNDPSYGYNPAVEAIINRLTIVLNNPCLPRELVPATDAENFGKVPCVVVEAAPQGDTACSCDGTRRRRDAAPEIHDPVKRKLAAAGHCDGPGRPACDSFCMCEILQAEGPALQSCQNDEFPDPTAIGYCYIDAESEPPVGNAELVQKCTPHKRQLRFVGEDTPTNGAVAVVACLGATLRGE